VSAVAKASAVRVRDSVYGTLLGDKELVAFEDGLRKLMNVAQDQVLFITLGSASRREVTEVSVMGAAWQRTTREGSIVA
jgi:CRISPR/Cas system-associated endoribonuclease Cas2